MYTGIFNSARFHQKLDFSNVRVFGKQLSDMDGALDYENRAWVLIEVKTEGTELPFGQKLYLTTLCDDLSRIKPCILLVLEHNTPVGQDILLEKTICRKAYFKGQWVDIQGVDPIALMQEFIRRFVFEPKVEDYSI